MHAQVAFGRFIFQIQQRRLWFEGVLVKLKPKEADLLAVLCERYPHLATRDEIIEGVWQGMVSDAALHQTVYRLRRALAQYDPSTFIETVPDRGIRLTAASPIDAHGRLPDGLHPASSVFQKAMSLDCEFPQAVLQTIELLEKVREQQPEYVPALEALATAYTNAGARFFYDPHEAYWRARKLVERIIEIEPSSARAYATLSVLHTFFNANRAAARAAAERATLLAPQSPAAHRAAAWECLSRRDFTGALTQADIALMAEPPRAYSAALFGTVLYMANRYNEAHFALRNAHALDDSFTMTLFYDACTYVMEHEYDLAERQLALTSGRDLEPRVIALRGYIAAKRGDMVAVERALSALRSSALPSHTSLCLIELGMDDYANAAAVLERALHTREPGLFMTAVDPLYEPLRAHAPGLIAAIEHGRPEQCDRCGAPLVMHRQQELHQCELCWDCQRGRIRTHSALKET